MKYRKITLMPKRGDPKLTLSMVNLKLKIVLKFKSAVIVRRTQTKVINYYRYLEIFYCDELLSLNINYIPLLFKVRIE